MSSQDLEVYHFQLNQVAEALERNPDNTELLKLQSDLRELITLAEALHTPEQTGNKSLTSEKKKNSYNKPSNRNAYRNSNNETTKTTWSVGQKVKAKWKDGKFYQAVILALPDPVNGRNTPAKVSVKYVDYDYSEYVNVNLISELDSEQKPSITTMKKIDDYTSNDVDSSKQDGPSSPDSKHNDDSTKPNNSLHNNPSVITMPTPPSVPITPATTAAISSSFTRPKKKSKINRDLGSNNKTENVHESKQKSWLSFISSTAGGSPSDSKNNKRKICSASLIRPILKKPSMFSTSDDPSARVGVVGSGKPMTKFHQRGKHVFSLFKI